ncbi:unnamed protein product [Nesidiocoris tenuis]|uniref:Homeotic protein spalt-major n=1 Tax=Nesidiocoris tenuis TaxID=355587 RepID=A0A6H5G654_9HEMI|nr:unnamed protein product [Nesidiocoris tenuis]
MQYVDAKGESCSGSDEDDVGPVTCPHCQVELPGYAELAEHSKDCVKVDDSCMSPSASVVSDDEYEGEKRQEEARRQRQDAENNNSVEEEEEDVGFHGLGHVTLKALQNTKVAVAQFAATAMANNADNPAALQELAVLQSTLYTLQHQQMMQLNLIQQLQQQLQITRPPKEGSPSSPPPRTPTPVRQEVPHPVPAPTPPSLSQQSSHPLTPTCQQVPLPPKPETSPPVQQSPLPPCSISSSFASSIITNLDPLPSPSEPNTLEMLQKRAQEVLDNASQGLLANNLADELAFRKSGGKGGLSPYDSKTGGRNEPFFKHRCRYCGKVFGSDSALQIHIRSHTGERPFKCNVCGSRFTTKGNLKVHFQRHSAKFPHIKMNPNPIPEHLDKYHPPLLAQMGAHQSLPPGPPHPPPYGGAPPSFPPSGLPMYRPPHAPHDLVLPPHHPRPPHDPMPTKPVLPPLPLFGPQDMPENLSKASSASPDRSCKEEPKEDANEDERLTPKRELVEGELVEPQERYPSSPPPYDDCSLDSSKYTMDDVPGDRDSPGLEKNDDSLQDQPENLSNKSTSDIGQHHLSLTPEHRLPPPARCYPDMVSPPSSTSSGSIHRGFLSSSQEPPDPLKDPAFYSSLLPRPGSTDNSWESLIEITKTSETHKLQLMVDNIENKMIDPNQCIICHRVLSCKSALQMHYRTHTGERPFRCKICGRAFTTKGNLKTHMGVHRIKPPMRMLHQCPVCHKKFTNGLVLQQHIRLHTGEPTDLTPEQIQAAEIRDFGPTSEPSPLRPFAFPSVEFPHNTPPINVPPPHTHSDQPHHSLVSSSPTPSSHSQSQTQTKEEDKPDFLDESRPSSVSPISDAAFSTSITALENQVRTITTCATNYHHHSSNKYYHHSPVVTVDDLSNNKDLNRVLPVNGEKSPASLSGSEGGPPLTPSPLNPSSSNVLSLAQMGQRHPPSPMHASESSTSLGALDLTPRSSSSTGGQLPPSVSHSLFSAAFGIPLPPGSMPGSPSPLMSTSALSSLTSSVLTTTAFNPLGLAIGPPGRGNTTCNLCFKTFACNSALEIHYRSHTKERPFKCTICDRGFSTKGNMKQHMLTHKIRDMPAHLFEQKAAAAGILPITSSAGSTQAPICPPQQPPTTQALPPSIGSSHLLGHGLPPPRPPSGTGASSVSNDGESRSSETSPTPPLAPPTQAPSQHLQQRLAAAVQHPAPPLPQQQLKPELGVKRSPPQGDTANMPLPKRQPSE